MVRGTQVVEEGYEFFADGKGVSIFTFPDFLGEFNNKASASWRRMRRDFGGSVESVGVGRRHCLGLDLRICLVETEIVTSELRLFFAISKFACLIYLHFVCKRCLDWIGFAFLAAFSVKSIQIVELHGPTAVSPRK